MHFCTVPYDSAKARDPNSQRRKLTNSVAPLARSASVQPMADDDGWGTVVVKKKKKKDKKPDAAAAAKVDPAVAKAKIEADRAAALAATLAKLDDAAVLFVEKKAKGVKHHKNAMRR